MPKRSKKEESESELDLGEESDEGFIVDDEEDYEAKPKKKTPAKKAAPKKKAAAAAGDDAEAPKPKKAKAPPPPTEPTVLPDGWVAHPPSLLYKPNPAAQGGTKIAAIDMDGTLILKKSANKYGPKDVNDWKWFNPEVPAKLQEAVADGFQVLIVSNQNSIKKALLGAASDKMRGLGDNVLKGLADHGVEAQIMYATMKDEYRKPATGMWDFFVENLNGGVAPNKEESFFLGDAAGRETDINDGAASDKEFAEAVGIKFMLPEDYFGGGGSIGANKALENAFRELADLIKKSGGEVFKASAFTKVAGIISEHPSPITSSKDLKGVKGVGPSSLAKIEEFLRDGKLAAIEELKGGEAQAQQLVSKDAEMALKFM